MKYSKDNDSKDSSNSITIQTWCLFRFIFYQINISVIILKTKIAQIKNLKHNLFLQINKFAGGNCQFSAGIGTKKMVCPDPFMGRLADQNAQLNR